MAQQPTNDPAELVVIGQITGVYGIKGWVKVHSYTQPVDNFLHYSGFFISQRSQWQAIEFAEIKPHGKGLVARIEGVADRGQAALLGRSDIAVSLLQLPQLDADDYYWHQLEGLRVCLADSVSEGAPVVLGLVDHMLATGANDVLVVQPSTGSLDQRERLIPYLPERVIKRVDLAAQTLWVDWDPEF